MRWDLDGEAGVHGNVGEAAREVLRGVASEEPLAEEAPDGVEPEEHEGHEHALDAVDADAALGLHGEGEGEPGDRVDGAGEGLEEKLAAEAEAPEGQGGLGPAVLDVVPDEDLAAQALVHVEDGEQEGEDDEGGDGLERLRGAVAAAALERVERVRDAGGPRTALVRAVLLVNVVRVGAEADLLLGSWNVAQPAVFLRNKVRWLSPAGKRF